MIACADAPLELWGGVECTVVRIGDDYRNQVFETGHASRMGDLDAMANLGVKTVRYPIVWETVAPEIPTELDFSWHDARLNRLRELGIKVIGGLVHHGSGPRYTSLLDDDFPDLLADYAGRVARRYPWIDLWTPVNEPLTTARFSCLYGHWYPHQTNIDAMLRATVIQCSELRADEASVALHPNAQLVVTEDIGKSYATDKLAYQRRRERSPWLSLDLLTGRIVDGHPFYRWVSTRGVRQPNSTSLQRVKPPPTSSASTII